MRTPDEIKTSIRACLAGKCSSCRYMKQGIQCNDGLLDDGLSYIQHLEAELVTTRIALSKDMGLCKICEHEGEKTHEDCPQHCFSCHVDSCPCKQCLDTDGECGFKWRKD